MSSHRCIIICVYIDWTTCQKFMYQSIRSLCSKGSSPQSDFRAEACKVSVIWFFLSGSWTECHEQMKIHLGDKCGQCCYCFMYLDKSLCFFCISKGTPLSLNLIKKHRIRRELYYFIICLWGMGRKHQTEAQFSKSRKTLWQMSFRTFPK